MKSRHLVEIVVFFAIFISGIIIKLYARKKVKDIEDSGTILKGKDLQGKVIGGGMEDEDEEEDME